MSDQSNDPNIKAALAPEIDEFKLKQYLEKMKDEQNFSMGLVGGSVAALIGAIIWAAITYTTNFQIGFMALGVGFLVGYAVRYMGKGIDKQFGIFGAVLALLGCALGNLLTGCVIISRHYEVSISQVLGSLDTTTITEIMTATFSPMDLLFYAIAVYQGYKFSFRRMNEAELAKLVK